MERACASAVAMRGRLRELGPIDTGSAPVTLRMSVGVHSGEYLLFAVGSSHRELLISGPAATEVVRMEKEAGTGEIVVSAATAAALPPRCVGPARGEGRLLRSAPPVIRTFAAPPPDTIDGSQAPVALSTELRAHVLAGPQPPEHRIVTVAFLRFEGIDGLVAARGPAGAAAALHELVTLVQDAADAEQVCFLGSDIDADGGKLILTAGAPRALGDEDERMLLALRRIIDDGPPLPLRIGVTHGPLFAGDIGPRYRRTYTVMGDVVNLAARLMAKAPPGELYTTAAVLERSTTQFRQPSSSRSCEGQGAACAGALGRPRRAEPRRGARPGAGAVPADRPRARARADHAGARRCAARPRAPDRAGERARDGSVAADGGGARPRRRRPRTARHVRAVHDGHAVRDLARAAAPGARRRLGRPGRRRVARLRRRWSATIPQCCRGCRCSPTRSTSTRPPARPSTSSRPSSAPPACARSCCASSAASCPRGR